MAVVISRPVHYFHLGVRGIIDGDPDGILTGELISTGNGTGGNHTLNLDWVTNAGDPKPDDVMVRINWINIASEIANAADHRIFLTKTLPWDGATVRQLGIITTGDLTPGGGMHLDFAQGLWMFPQKDDTAFLQTVSTNVDLSVKSFTLQGYYWYMGRLRRRLMENPLQ